MIFSERLKVAKEVDAWIEEYGAAKNTASMLAAIDALGYLKNSFPAPVTGASWRVTFRDEEWRGFSETTKANLNAVISDTERLAALVLDYTEEGGGVSGGIIGEIVIEMRRLAALLIGAKE